MVLRIVGVLLLLLGVAMSAFLIWGLSDTRFMAELFSAASQAQGFEFDAPTWSHHWRLNGVILLCIGIGVAISGAIVVQRKPWGLLLFATTAAFAAVFPWAYMQLGFARYGFEDPSLADSSVYGLLALLAILSFIVSRTRAGT
ncbi:MAG: hypothetical protein WCD66_11340 [Rhodanobacteraceae bacterium]